jgi:probable rRNA maturation factor
MAKASSLNPGLIGLVTLELTGNSRIRTIKQSVFGLDQVTDVVTLNYDPIPGDPDPIAGELFVNAARAHACAPQRQNWSADHELALYIAHSFDHLCGHDDGTESERRSMRRRDLRWVHDADADGLVRGLFS